MSQSEKMNNDRLGQKIEPMYLDFCKKNTKRQERTRLIEFLKILDMVIKR